MLHRIIRVSLLTLLVTLQLVSTASAHAIVLRTDPLDGAALTAAPDHVHLWFSEEILLNYTSFQLTDGSNPAVELSTFHLDGQDPTEIIIDMPSLKPNAYRLTWKTASSDDLHVSTGSIVFGVQQAAELAVPPPVVPLPQPIEVLLRWLNFGALAGLIGALAVAYVLLPSASQAETASAQLSTLTLRLHRRLWWLAVIMTLAALVVGAGLLMAQAASAGGFTVDNLLQVITKTNYGSYWLMREAWLIVLLFVLALRGRDSADRLTFFALLPLILAFVVTQSLTSHAAAFADISPLRIGADVAHLLAASLWAGGLLALAIALTPLMRRGPAEKALARSVLRRFSVLAAISVGVLAVTGLYSSGQQVASLDALLTTAYGQGLLLKIGLVLSVGLIGLINSSLLHPRVADVIRRSLRRPIGWSLLDRQHVGRTVLIEAIGASTVLLFAAWLGASQPARGPEFDPPAADAAAPALPATQVADLMFTLSVKPDRPGQNFISVGVFNTRRPAPAPIGSVTLRLTPPDGQRGPIELAAVPQADGRYEVTGNVIDMTGGWQIGVIVKRAKLADVILTAPWTVLPALPTTAARPVLVSNQPLAPLLTPAAGLLAIFIMSGVLGCALILRRQRARSGIDASTSTGSAQVERTPAVKSKMHWFEQ